MIATGLKAVWIPALSASEGSGAPLTDAACRYAWRGGRGCQTCVPLAHRAGGTHFLRHSCLSWLHLGLQNRLACQRATYPSSGTHRQPKGSSDTNGTRDTSPRPHHPKGGTTAKLVTWARGTRLSRSGVSFRWDKFTTLWTVYGS